MPDVQEVFRVSTQDVKPDPGALERQQTLQRRRSIGKKLGPFAVAAAIITVAVVAIVAGSRGGSDPNEAVNSSTPAMAEAEGVANGFLSALGGFDADGALALLSDDAFIRDLTGAEPGFERGVRTELRLYVALLEAQGYEQIIESCDATSNLASRIGVVCHFDFHLLRSGEIGRGPYDGSFFELTIEDGKVVRASAYWNYVESFSGEMWEPFAEWVSTTHPEDVAVMYTDDTLSMYRLEEESIVLWESRTQEYAEMKGAELIALAESFIQARNASDVDGALSFVADDGASAQLLYNNRIYVEGTMPSISLDRDELALAFEAERLLEVQYGEGGCSAAPEGDLDTFIAEAQVVCTFEMESRLRRIAGIDPGPTEFAIGFRDDRITYLGLPWLNASFPGGEPAESARFVEWVEAEHPEAGGVFREGELFRIIGQEVVLKLTPETVQLLGTYLDEYEASQA